MVKVTGGCGSELGLPCPETGGALPLESAMSNTAVDSLHDVHPEPEETFWYWVRERQFIYEKRQRGESPPWTDDEILRTFSFCNVYREQDRVTVWIDQNIRKPYADHPNLWIMLAIARTINWPPTLQAIINTSEVVEGIWPDNKSTFVPLAMGRFMDHLKQQTGEKLYTGAYMIRAESDPKSEWYSRTKQEYIGGCVIGNLWKARGEFTAMFLDSIYHANPYRPSLQEVHAWFTHFHGWGPFMAYEVVTDLRHTRYLRNAPDIMTWANAGPGAIRGLKRMFPNQKFTHPEHYNAGMQYLLERSNEMIPDHFPRMEMRDIEHVACEFDKYSRVKHGEGRPRSLFVAGRGDY
jgi:hypothetical protein